MTYNIEDIKDPSFIKTLSDQQLMLLCEDIREFLIESLSKTGGHLSSNLGVVELTVALHKVFDSPKDKFIWDVGHQVYPHKILTGRASQFPTLRQYRGLSGFPKRSESIHDCWETGHASTSISAAVGMACARDLNQEDYNVIAVIGDGSLTGGLAYEALNHMGHLNKKMIVIINDNEMAISPNVGGFSSFVSNLRTRDSYINTKRHIKQIIGNRDGLQNLVVKTKEIVKEFTIGKQPYEEMGFTYFGPVDGHHLNDLIRSLKYAKKLDKPILIHVKTIKGKGYSYAENDKQGFWHGVGKFDRSTGLGTQSNYSDKISWSQLICNGLIELTKHDSRVAVITPAMIKGSALIDYEQAYPERLIDVGIAEEHAVTMAGGMATQGLKPFVSIYSTFLKRAFDQVHHDVARQKLNVVFGIDRAGIIGADGETHQGIYDIPMLRPIPNMTIMMPRNATEAFDMLYTAYQIDGPVAIRYPRGNVSNPVNPYSTWTQLEIGTWQELKAGKDLYLISIGPILDELVSLAEDMKCNQGVDIGVINARFIKPLDFKMLNKLASKQQPVIVYEESAVIGGLGTAIIEYYNETNQTVNVKRLGIPDRYIQHGSVSELLSELHLTKEDIKKEIEIELEREEKWSEKRAN